MYAKTLIATGAVESVGPIPSFLMGLDDASLSNLSWCDGHPELQAYGYVPVNVDPMDAQVLAWINTERSARGLSPVA